MNGDRLTRQELGWLLTQEAKSAAEKLRKGAAVLGPNSKGEPNQAEPSSMFDPALDALDEAMSMLSSLYRGAAPRGRKGRIDLSALVWEVAPHARVSIEPGGGTEVYGDEAELRRMLQLLLGGTSITGADGEGVEVSIRGEGTTVRVSVPLGPDPSASAETERAWLSRMAIRYGGRLELEGGTQSIVLPADSGAEKAEIAALKRELEAAQRQGEAYARELAAVFAQIDARPTDPTPPPPSTTGAGDPPPSVRRSDPSSLAPVARRSPLELVSLSAGTLAGRLRTLFAAVAREAAAMRDLTARELDGHPAAAPLQQLAQRLGARLETGSDLVSDLARLGGVLPEARRQRHRIDVAELVREECDALSGRAARHGIVLKKRIPDSLDASTIPSLARLLVRLLLEAALASTPPGGSVACALVSNPEQGRARLLVEDGGPALSKEELARLMDLDFERTLVGRQSELELLAAFAIASELSTRLELSEGDEGGLVARVWL